MITLHRDPVILRGNAPAPAAGLDEGQIAAGVRGTMAHGILAAHDRSGEGEALRIKFDSLISHDITYVGILQTARAGGLTRFPVKYALTNCHNSLCAVGGTINEDDHVFGLSAAQKFGGIYVPANQAVIHQYARETMVTCGGMILGSDSHTRYGPLGTMGVGEGGPEIVKQLLSDTYDIPMPEIILVYLKGKPQRGVGPHDVALALCKAVYENGFAKNKVLEFAGPGVSALSMDFRIGVDVMTTETACLSSIWTTDDDVGRYYEMHGRAEDYKSLRPVDGAVYSGMIGIDLSKIAPMIALPPHPSNAWPIAEFKANAGDILRETEREMDSQYGGKANIRLTDKLKNGEFIVDQGIIAGCAGGMYENISEAAAIMKGGSVGDGYFSLSVYPPSVPVNLELIKSGVQRALLEAGALFKPCFCGPCFGAGDVPSNNAFSIRHTTRNFLNREGAKPGEGQAAAVALMDARSVAATAASGGRLTAATEIGYAPSAHEQPGFDGGVYARRVYDGFEKPDPAAELRFGPNIAPWPDIPAMPAHLLLNLASVIRDPVTTTDELIPSGETSSYRSNPMRLADFTLSRRDPDYVPRAKAVLRASREALLNALKPFEWADVKNTGYASAIYANMPGDGSAREQAASCQRVLGGGANICREYATKRYRSNLINWGILPFTSGGDFPFEPGDLILLPNIRETVSSGGEEVHALSYSGGEVSEITLYLKNLTAEDRRILINGCLMNDYAARKDG